MLMFSLGWLPPPQGFFHHKLLLEERLKFERTPQAWAEVWTQKAWL
jgi:hypothetical protein